MEAQAGNDGGLSSEVLARIESVERKLAELDPILRRFCAENGYMLSKIVGVWPRRKIWIREEIDRSLDLTTDVSVSEVMERGFFETMPWSLHATASEMLRADGPCHFLCKDVFGGLLFSELAAVLPGGLQQGLLMLRNITVEQVIAEDKGMGRRILSNCYPGGGSFLL